MSVAATSPSSARREPGEDTAGQPVEQRSLIARLTAEVAALRAALDASHQRIADLESESARDPVCSLLNRRGMLREIERALAFYVRFGMGATLVYLDLDRFETIQEHGGHAVGDAAVKAVAAAIRRAIRSSDHAARLGGDEFALLLWNCDLAGAERRLAGLFAEIERLTVTLPDGTTRTIRASAGMASFIPGDTAEALIARADAAMYRARAERRAAPRR